MALDGGNLFLESLLLPGEKDVSPVVLPSELSDELAKGNCASSVLEALAPAIQAVKNGVWMEMGRETKRESYF